MCCKGKHKTHRYTLLDCRCLADELRLVTCIRVDEARSPVVGDIFCHEHAQNHNCCGRNSPDALESVIQASLIAANAAVDLVSPIFLCLLDEPGIGKKRSLQHKNVIRHL